jgi:hypothetical protein
MKRWLRKIGALLFCSGLLMLSAYLSYLCTRAKLVPAPIRAFRSNPTPFRAFVASVRKGDQEHPTSDLRGVSRIRIESNYVFFIFANLPPDSIQVIGCSLQAEEENLAIPLLDRQKTFRFERLEPQWFYWEYD